MQLPLATTLAFVSSSATENLSGVHCAYPDTSYVLCEIMALLPIQCITAVNSCFDTCVIDLPMIPMINQLLHFDVNIDFHHQRWAHHDD
jgi:hypothetical protein